MIKRWDHLTTPRGDSGDNRKETFEPPKEVRRLLRQQAGVQMWQIEEVRPRPGQRWPAIHYEVTSAGTVKVFGRPHEAWQCFQTLTNAPDARPEPPRNAGARPRTS